jgi:hypothetical protein
MLNKEAVLAWTNIEHVLYEENGHEFIVEFDLFNNHQYFYHHHGGCYIELATHAGEDIYDCP